MILRLALILAALGAAFLPLPAAWVESLYSERLYLAWQHVATRVSNLVPFALFDGLLAGAAAWLAWEGVSAFRTRGRDGGLRAIGRFALRAASGIALVYLVFLAAWGLNYRRVPLASRLQFSAERAGSAAVRELALSTAAEAGRLRETLTSSPGEARAGGGATRQAGPAWAELPGLLAPSFARVQGQLARVTPAIAGRPKRTLLSYYFQRSGVDGMTDPFFLEILVNGSILPFERPFITAHEWAHLAGYADEAEANFIGWLVCLQGPPPAQYSAHLALLWQVLPVLADGDRQAVVTRLSPGVREDLRAIQARVAKTTPIIRRASWRIYDRYLKANRVERGVESYDAALTLLLGTRFLPGWVPARRVP